MMRVENGSQNQESLLYLVGLTKIEKVGPKTCRLLLQHFGSAEEVFLAKKKLLGKIPGIGEKTIQAIHSKEILNEAEKELVSAKKFGIDIVTWFDPRYPKRLKEIADSPLVLYCRGKLSAIDQPQIAIVGTRTPTNYGKKIAADFASYFAKLGIAVVSGLAYGIDYEAHVATMEMGGRTIAVLGHGLEQVYPRDHSQKALQIIETGGALISEFPIGTQPDAFNFPARNRIISGLSEAVVVIEAAEKGGALITANMAFEQNREVFAIPGNLGAATSIGCNRLIRDNVAKLVCEPADVIDGLQHLLQYRQQDLQEKRPRAALQLSEREQSIIDQLLEVENEEFDSLARKTNIAGNELRGILLGLEFRKVIRSLPGNKFQFSG